MDQEVSGPGAGRAQRSVTAALLFSPVLWWVAEALAMPYLWLRDSRLKAIAEGAK